MKMKLNAFFVCIFFFAFVFFLPTLSHLDKGPLIKIYAQYECDPDAADPYDRRCVIGCCSDASSGIREFRLCQSDSKWGPWEGPECDTSGTCSCTECDHTASDPYDRRCITSGTVCCSLDPSAGVREFRLCQTDDKWGGWGDTSTGGGSECFSGCSPLPSCTNPTPTLPPCNAGDPPQSSCTGPCGGCTPDKGQADILECVSGTWTKTRTECLTKCAGPCINPTNTPIPTTTPRIIPTPTKSYFVCDNCFYRGPYSSLICPTSQPVSCNSPCDPKTSWTCTSNTNLNRKVCDTEANPACIGKPSPTPSPPGLPTLTPPGGIPTLTPTPTGAFGGGGGSGLPFPPPAPAGCSPGEVATLECLQGITGNILVYAFYLSGIIGLIMIIYAGIQFVTSGGNPQKAQSAKDTLKFVVIGAILLAFSYVFLWVISKLTGANFL